MKNGFSLIEIIIVVGIMTLLIAVADPLTSRFQAQNAVQNAALSYAQALRRASLLSTAMSQDSSWGVFVATSSSILFKGSTYALRDQNYDEAYPFPSSVLATDITEIDFRKFTGLPASSATTTFSSTDFSKVVTINIKGNVSY